MSDKNLEKIRFDNPPKAGSLNDLYLVRQVGDTEDTALKAKEVRDIVAPLTNEKEYNSSGTAYTLTATSANIVFGTSGAAQVSIDKAGKYRITAEVVVNYVGATFASVRDLNLKLRRTNTSAADVANSSRTIKTDIVTTVNSTLAYITLSAYYTPTSGATTTPDVVQLFGNISVLPTAGSLQVVSANIKAERILT